jgi:hypothetical protein
VIVVPERAAMKPVLAIVRAAAAQACFSRHRAASGRGVSGAGVAYCPLLAQPTCTR